MDKERPTKSQSQLDRLFREEVPSKRSGRHAPRMLRLLPLLAVIVLIGTFMTYVIFVGLARLQGFHVSWWSPRDGSLKNADLSSLVRDSATFVALAGGIFAVLYAYRKQRIEEAAGHRADSESLAKRYQDAAGQLGHDSAAVRLAGVYAMARLADDWPEERQTCADVLVAYLRMPWEFARVSDEAEVRRSIVAVIEVRTSAIDSARSWSALTFNFANATFADFRFANTTFLSRPNFEGCTFLGRARLSNVSLPSGATFERSSFPDGLAVANPRFAGVLTFAGSTFGDGGPNAFTIGDLPEGARLVLGESIVSGRVQIVVDGGNNKQGDILLTNLEGDGTAKVTVVAHTPRPLTSATGVRQFPRVHDSSSPEKVKVDVRRPVQSFPEDP